MVTKSCVDLLQLADIEGTSHLNQSVPVDLISLSIVTNLVAEEISNFSYNLRL